MKSQLLNITRSRPQPQTSHPGRNNSSSRIWQGAAFHLKRLPALLEVLATWFLSDAISIFMLLDVRAKDLYTSCDILCFQELEVGLSAAFRH